APLGGWERGDLAAVVDDAALAGDVALGQQAHDRAAEDRLAGARLADDAERAPPVEGERHAVDGPHRAGRRAEPGPQVGDLEQGLGLGGRRHRPPSLTSKRALTTSPR